MNTESLNFIEQYLKEPSLVIEDVQNYLKTKRVANSKTYMLLSIFSYYLKTEPVNNLCELIRKFFENEPDFNCFSQIVKENVQFIKDLFDDFSNSKYDVHKLVDIEWKFVGVASLEQAESGAFEPKIILNLIFSDNTAAIMETDFGTLKKLQEELELASSSFNSGYARRLNAFTK